MGSKKGTRHTKRSWSLAFGQVVELKESPSTPDSSDEKCYYKILPTPGAQSHTQLKTIHIVNNISEHFGENGFQSLPALPTRRY